MAQFDPYRIAIPQPIAKIIAVIILARWTPCAKFGAHLPVGIGDVELDEAFVFVGTREEKNRRVWKLPEREGSGWWNCKEDLWRRQTVVSD